MAHLQIEQRLETLGGQSIFHVVLPEAGDLHEAPVIYLRSEEHTSELQSQ